MKSIEIKRISYITKDEIEGLGFNGYRTDVIYQIEKENKNTSFVFSIKEKKLNTKYIKEWETIDSSVAFFQEIINKGHSFGAYEEGVLIGLILLDYYKWNNSMWIENIRISEKHQGIGLGRSFIRKSIEEAKTVKSRILGLETQSTNYPAVQFYLKCGFQISGVDFSRYPQRSGDLEQVAIIMNYKISE